MKRVTSLGAHTRPSSLDFMRMPWVRNSERTLKTTLMVTGNSKDPYTLMIEPWGMTYDLGADDRVYVDLDLPAGEHPELVAWPGGFSIYVGGRAVTRDRLGEVLHEF